jgi:predicted HAD superfamily Cof-like phosphohydrolase
MSDVRGPQQMVTEFHQAFGLPVATELAGTVQGELAELRLRLLDEEVAELHKAIDSDDLVNAAQELADIIYVTYGHAIVLGVDLDAVFAEVHRANMSKLENGRPVMREDGKVLKGSNYQAPDISSILLRQGGAAVHEIPESREVYEHGDRKFERVDALLTRVACFCVGAAVGIAATVLVIIW